MGFLLHRYKLLIVAFILLTIGVVAFLILTNQAAVEVPPGGVFV